MLIGLSAIIVLFTILWLISLAIRNSSIVDIWWGPGILAIGLAYWLTTAGAQDRARLTIVLTAIWAIRLALHIGVRNIGHGEDFRYAAWRRERGTSWWWFSYFKVFLLQSVIAWIVALPLYFAITSPGPSTLGLLDYLGVILFAIGLTFEAAGDEQLRRFKADPANRGRVLGSGLWRFTRHPNYFGEALLWWGLGLIGASTPGGAVALIGPAVMTFLLVRVSGVALLERTLLETRPGYADYVARTPAFFPWPRFMNRP